MRIKTYMRYMYVTMLASMVMVTTAFAALSAEAQAQVIAILTLIIPALVGVIKKLKIPTWLTPFMPLLLGMVVQVSLALTGVVDMTVMAALAVGAGVGGVASSGYDAHKKIKAEWVK